MNITRHTGVVHFVQYMSPPNTSEIIIFFNGLQQIKRSNRTSYPNKSIHVTMINDIISPKTLETNGKRNFFGGGPHQTIFQNI